MFMAWSGGRVRNLVLVTPIKEPGGFLGSLSPCNFGTFWEGHFGSKQKLYGYLVGFLN